MRTRQKILLAVTFIAMFHLLLLIAFGDNGLMEFSRMNNRLERLQKVNTRLTRENLKMYRIIDRLQNDSTFVENIARRELGMVGSNELIFKFKDGP